MSASSYAAELWRYGEPELAERAARLTVDELAAIGDRAGAMSLSGEAARLWPDGPSSPTDAAMLAAIEHLEGRARPCARARRLPRRSLPEAYTLTEPTAAEAALRQENAMVAGLVGGLVDMARANEDRDRAAREAQFAGVAGADENRPTLAQKWWLTSWPEADVLELVIDALALTMPAPFRRFDMMDASLLHTPVGSWSRSRAKAMTFLREGVEGHDIIELTVTSHNRGGYNWFPESLIRLTRRQSGARPWTPMLECNRAIAPGDDVDGIVASWATIIDTHLGSIVEARDAALVGRHRYGEVIAFD